MFVPVLNDDITGVNCMLNEFITDYTEERNSTINSLKIKIAKYDKNIDSYMYLEGTNYTQ